MTSGFKDQYGNAVKLSENAKENAQMLIAQAKKSLVQHQKINENAKAIEAIKNKVSQNTQNIDKNTQKIDKNKHSIDKNAQNIDKNAQSIEFLQKELAKSNNSKIKISLSLSVLAILLSLANLCLYFKLF